MFCGSRRGEVSALRWSDVKRDVIHLNYNLNKEGIEPTKSGAEKVIPMMAGTTKVLKELRKRQNFFREKYWHAYQKSDFIVTKDDGSPMNMSTISHSFGKMLKKNNLKHVRFHDLRHTAATLLLFR